MNVLPVQYSPVIAVRCFFTQNYYFATRGGVYTIDGTTNYYRGTLLDDPAIVEELGDLYYGVERSSRLTLKFADPQNGVDPTWADIVNTDEIRGKWVGVYRYEDTDGSWLEFRGKVVNWKISPGNCTLTLEMRDDTTLDTYIPSKFVTADEFPNAPAEDIGKEIPLVFGNCKDVPLRHVNNDLTNNHYDYVICYTGGAAIEGIDTGGVKRNGVFVNSAEYTFFDGSQASPYPGFAFIRFSYEQRDFRDDFYKLTADVKGLKLYGDTTATRNFAKILRVLLEDPNIGIGDAVNADSFTAAASKLDNLGDMWCDLCVSTKTKVRDIVDELLQVCRGRLLRSASGNWEISVDTAYIDTVVGEFGYMDNQFDNIIKLVDYTTTHANSTFGTVSVVYDNGQKQKSVEVSQFGSQKKIELKCVRENGTADKFLQYLYGMSTVANKKVTIVLDIRARLLKAGDVVFLSIPLWGISGEYRIESITRRLATFQVVLHRYSSEIYSPLSIADPTPPSEFPGPTDTIKWDMVAGDKKPDDRADVTGENTSANTSAIGDVPVNDTDDYNAGNDGLFFTDTGIIGRNGGTDTIILGIDGTVSIRGATIDDLYSLRIESLYVNDIYSAEGYDDNRISIHNSLVPNWDNSINLGKDTNRWGTIFAFGIKCSYVETSGTSGTVYTTALRLPYDTTAEWITINNSLCPSLHRNMDLGRSGASFRTAYVGTVQTDSISLENLLIATTGSFQVNDIINFRVENVGQLVPGDTRTYISLVPVLAT